MPRVDEWLLDVQPDVVCMQETKLAEDAFPTEHFPRWDTNLFIMAKVSGTASQF